MLNLEQITILTLHRAEVLVIVTRRGYYFYLTRAVSDKNESIKLHVDNSHVRVVIMT